MLGCVRMNSPSALSIVKPLTPPPFMVMTSCVEAPYMVKPAATSSVPGRRRSSFVPFDPSANLWIPKIVPTETPASKFEEPSIGSHATAYRAPLCSGKQIRSSSSSDTRTAHFPEDFMAAMKTSLPITSSFFWSSPVVLLEPARPVRLMSVARRM